MNHIKKAYKYPYLTDLINNGGGLSMEYVLEMKVSAVAFDEGGVIWEGKRGYDSLKHYWMTQRRG